MPTYKINNLEITTSEQLKRDSELFGDDTVAVPTATAAKGYIQGSGAEASILQLASPGMAVRVTTAGVAYNHRGVRIVAPTATSITVTAADGTNPRYDIVVLKEDGTYAVRAGTPGEVPADPTLVAGDVPLARLNILAGSTTVTTGVIADLRSREYLYGSKIIDGSVGAAELATSAVTTAKIAAAAVTKAKALVFCSTEQTGTGSEQTIAHGLAATPAFVLVVVTDNNAGDAVVTEGTHTSTNVLVTVTTSVKYKVLAWA